VLTPIPSRWAPICVGGYEFKGGKGSGVLEFNGDDKMLDNDFRDDKISIIDSE
jgi:hypothetical protein